MKAQAISYIRESIKDGQNLEVQTITRYYYINETEGDQWELLRNLGLLAIYKGDKIECVDIDHIISITIDNPDNQKF